MAKASKDRNLVADPDVEMVLDPAAACLECKVCDVSVKLWSAIRTVEKKTGGLTSVQSRRQTCEQHVFTTDVANNDDTGRPTMTGRVDNERRQTPTGSASDDASPQRTMIAVIDNDNSRRST